MAQLVERLTSAQVMISRFVSLSPTSGSVLMARSLEPASVSVSPSLCPSPARLCLSLTDLFCLALYPLALSMLLQLERFHSFFMADSIVCTHTSLKKIFFNIYSFLKGRETEREWRRGRERGRHRNRSRLQALSCQHRARRGARTHKL